MNSVLTLGFELSPRSNIPDFFNPLKTKYRDMLANPGTTRYGGWDLQTLDQPQIKKADYYEVINGDRKIVRLYQDGSLVAKANLDSSFLGHASDTYSKNAGEALINPIALCEFVYNFVSFSLRILATMEVKDRELIYGFKMMNLKDRGIDYVLSPIANNFLFGQDAQPPSGNHLQGNLMVAYNEKKRTELVNSISYDLVKNIFLNFGFSEDRIPLFNHDTKEFELEKVKKM